MNVVRRSAIVFLIIAFPLLARAQAREKVFDASPAKLYAAVQKVLADQYVIFFENPQQMIVSFRTPETNTAAMEGSATIEPEDGKARLRVHLQPVREQSTWGKGGRIANSILNSVEEELGKKPAKTPN